MVVEKLETPAGVAPATDDAVARGAAASGPTAPSDDTQALMPAYVRRWVLSVVLVLVAAAVYVLGVRGEVLLNGLAAVAAYCF